MENKLKQEIVVGLRETAEQLLETIQRFNEEEFNTVPFENSWTAGQVAEHLYKAESGLPRLFATSLKKTSRPPDQYVDSIRNTFLDFNTQLKSPEFIIPTDVRKNPADFVEKFTNSRKAIIESAEQVDLSDTIRSVQFPGAGELTGYEWLTLVVNHSKRHIRQMQNIHKALLLKV